ncbi:MAG: D-alanyl-D-alanine carboxypeptidase family protein [Ruminococcaceae bacterium]|nr:D-alanyl-D-alanine carboxypeptidase family protein [Oscillospiraceae bacterium]
MTREQAEKIKRAKRRKRRQRKQLMAFMVLWVVLTIIIALAVMAVKGITGFIKDKKDSSSAGTDVSISETVESTDESADESADESTDESGDESTAASSGVTDVSSQEESSSQEEISSENQTTDVTQKPEQTWSTMLVNIWSHMPEGYVPEVRRVYNCGADTGKDFDVRAADALELMLSDARAAGYNMYLVSAYRTYDYQVGLFNRKLNEYKNAGYDDETAYNEASQWVAIPGTSEHCIGLAADIVSSTWYNTNSDLTHSFEDTEHFEWLYENCADYGFILRYPKGKEAVTAITYEPWHYRYVGVEAAKYIMANGLTLEEFCAQ